MNSYQTVYENDKPTFPASGKGGYGEGIRKAMSSICFFFLERKLVPISLIIDIPVLVFPHLKYFIFDNNKLCKCDLPFSIKTNKNFNYILMLLDKI